MLSEVTAHGLVHLVLLDGAEAKLNCFITIGFGGLDLADRVRCCFDNRNRNDRAVFVEELGHTDFSSVDSINHQISLPTA